MRQRLSRKDIVRTLAEHQLVRLIERGEWIDLCQAEWERRYGRPYPWRLTSTGWTTKNP